MVGYYGVAIKNEFLLKGKNTVAVSVHQSSASSSDLFFDLDLRGMTEAEKKELDRTKAKE